MKKIFLAILLFLIIVGSIFATLYLKNNKDKYDYDYSQESYFDQVNDFAINETNWDIATKG